MTSSAACLIYFVLRLLIAIRSRDSNGRKAVDVCSSRMMPARRMGRSAVGYEEFGGRTDIVKTFHTFSPHGNEDSGAIKGEGRRYSDVPVIAPGATYHCAWRMG